MLASYQDEVKSYDYYQDEKDEEMRISKMIPCQGKDGLTMRTLQDISFSSPHQMLLQFKKLLTTLRTSIAIWKKMAMEGIRWFHRLLATMESIGF
jgi:hypothetical protein